MDIQLKLTRVNQTGPNAAYRFLSIFGLVLDFVAYLYLFLSALFLIVIFASLMLPIFVWLIDRIGYPQRSIELISFNTIDLAYAGIAGGRVALLTIVLAVFAIRREHIARPFRSVWSLGLGLLFSVPSILWLSVLLPEIGVFEAQIKFLENVLEFLLLGAAFSPSSGAFEVLSIYIAIFLSSFMFLAYVIVFAVWSKSLGRLRTSVKKRLWPSIPKFLMYIRIFLSKRNTLKGFFFWGLACTFGSMPLAVYSIEPPGFLDPVLIYIIQNNLLSPFNAAFAEGVFWPVVSMSFGVFTYLMLVRPRPRNFILLSSILPLVSFFLPSGSYSNEYESPWHQLILFSIWIIPVFGFMHAGYKALVRGGGLARKDVIKSDLSDTASLLLLRNFALDNVLVKASTPLIWFADIVRSSKVRLEEVIVREAFLIAPVVAVANPTDSHEPLGAIREYLSDDEWQPFVSEKIAASRAIIFILGRGNYTGWETQQILRNDAAGRVVFIVPPDPKPALEYLDQNPEIQAQIGGDVAMRLIGSGRVRGFVSSAECTTFVMNRFKSELSYILAVRRLLDAVSE